MTAELHPQSQRTWLALRRGDVARWLKLALAITSWQIAIGVAVSQSIAPLDDNRFEMETVVHGGVDIMQMAMLPDSRIIYIERRGRVYLVDAASRQSTEIARIEVGLFGEVGLVGVTLDHEFDAHPWVYLFYCPKAKPDVMRLARIPMRNSRLNQREEEILLEYGIDKDFATHMGGGLAMSAAGDLYVGTGDNTIPIPELPLDQRPGNEHLDAMRTSGNSKDLRGAILRIHPEREGGYSIPAGNLFADALDGRPEIYAMGCRNPFRISYDDESQTLFWGDVGPNISMDVAIGPNGYDEFNATTTAGNFGWPMFVGPNEAYYRYDFSTGKLGRAFDPNRPMNDSRNNTGARLLPPARPAMVWYPSIASRDFPELGTGGRSAMSGPLFRDRDYYDAVLKIPAYYDGALFVFDWTRNWIMAIWRDADGEVRRIEPFMPNQQFRKPIHMTLANDGTLYLVEFGDKWYENRDSRIVRIVYRRGNRSPRPVVTVTQVVGKAPLETRLDATGTLDPDQDEQLLYRWEVDGKPIDNAASPTLDLTLHERGVHNVRLSVTDTGGATSTVDTKVSVGNARPQVRFRSPPHGSFFDWGEFSKYRVQVEDEEDGSSRMHEIADNSVVVKATYRQRLRSRDDEAQLATGLAIMQESTCFACHATATESGGPPYLSVARKYAEDEAARAVLARKIVTGGSGVWGKKAMPAHPNHTLEEAEQMAEWILSLAWDRTRQVTTGHDGVFQMPEQPSHRGNSGIVVIEADYRDLGAGEIPTASGTAECVLHSRRKKPAFADRLANVNVVDVFEGEGDLVGFFQHNGVAVFEQIEMSRIREIRLRVAHLCEPKVKIELRADGVDGPMLATASLSSSTADVGVYSEIVVPVDSIDGVHDLYVIAKNEAGAATATVAVRWIDFELTPATSVHTKILLVPVAADDEELDSQLRLWCNLLAKLFNQLDEIKAVVSSDANWPSDHRVVANSRAIVFCQAAPPNADVDATPKRLQENVDLMKQLGVGVAFVNLAPTESHPDPLRANALGLVKSLDSRRWPSNHPILSTPIDWPRRVSEHEPWLQGTTGDRARAIGWLRAPEGAGRRVDLVAPLDARLLLEPAFVNSLVRATLWSGWQRLDQGGNLWLDPALIPAATDLLATDDATKTRFETATYDRAVPGGWVLPPPASTFAGPVDELFMFISTVGFVIAAGVAAIGMTFCILYRHRPGHAARFSPNHNWPIEVAWSVLPAIVLATIFFRGFKSYLDMQFAPLNAYEIDARAKKWSWSFTYPNGHVDEELHVPAGKPVRLLLRSDDVIHSLFIPAFRVKMDCVPGRYTHLWFQANEPTAKGFSHPLFCAEYCGTQHSKMTSRVVVHEPVHFENWLQSAREAASALTPVQAGQRLYQIRGCLQCHTLDGTTRPGGGPSFLGAFGTEQLMTDGQKLTVDENYIRESILNPIAKVRSGYRPMMPTYQGQLSDGDIDNLLAFIKSLAAATSDDGIDASAAEGVQQ